MSLKIHAFPVSPRAFKVLSVAGQLDLKYELVICDLTKGMQKTADYTAINPNQKMPALEDGGFKLWESNAMIQYLATKRPDAGMAGRDEQERADILRWQFWESTTWDPACAILMFENFVKQLFMGQGPDPAEVEKGTAKFHTGARILDAQLKGRRFICGDRISLADFSLSADLSAAKEAKLPLEPYAEIQRWIATMSETQGWRAARALQPQAAAAA